jgi:ribosome maturation factor RimP
MRRGRIVPSFCSELLDMIEKETVIRLVEEKLTGSVNYLTDVVVKPGNLIVVEIDNDDGVSIDDCAELSRYIEERLDREADDYELEVGSAGITSPFKVLRQYLKNVGNEVELGLKSGVKQTGILKSADENGIVLTVEKQVKPEGAKRKQTVEEDLSYLFNEIKYTKYVIRFK